MQEPADETLIQVTDIFEIKFRDSSNEIKMDFSYLFSETGGRLPPYESLYNYPLWDKPRLWGIAAEELRGLYQSAGIVSEEEFTLIADHLSVELFFMGYLIENDLIEQQKIFLEKHLLSWVPDYCDEIKRVSRTFFYKQIADLLREYILDECEAFGIETVK